MVSCVHLVSKNAIFLRENGLPLAPTHWSTKSQTFSFSKLIDCRRYLYISLAHLSIIQLFQARTHATMQASLLKMSDAKRRVREAFVIFEHRDNSKMVDSRCVFLQWQQQQQQSCQKSMSPHLQWYHGPAGTFLPLCAHWDSTHPQHSYSLSTRPSQLRSKQLHMPQAQYQRQHKQLLPAAALLRWSTVRA